MALEPFALITLEELKRRLSIPVEDTKNDADLEDRINEASYWLHGDGVDNFGYLGRYLIAKDYQDELYKAHDRQDLITDNYPINSIISVEFRYYTQSNFAPMSPDDYFIHRKKYAIVREQGWNKVGSSHYLTKTDLDYYSIKVSYNAGYATIPFDIKGALKDMIADSFTIDETGGQGLKQYKINDVSITWKDKVDPRVMKVFNKYRKRRA